MRMGPSIQILFVASWNFVRCGSNSPVVGCYIKNIRHTVILQRVRELVIYVIGNLFLALDSGVEQEDRF